MKNKKLFIFLLLLSLILLNLCCCEYNIYFPPEKEIPHDHNTDRLCQDGYLGHHWECTICGEKTAIEAHKYDSNDVCTVCGYAKSSEESSIGGFTIDIIIKEPFGHISYSYESNGKWRFWLVDDGNPDYPIVKWTWYVFGEEISTDKEFIFDSPYEISYEISCTFENDYGYGDSTVVITGRTD